MITKIVQRFGNSGHIVMPKEYVGKRIRFISEPKTFNDIKSGILEILKPYLENIIGVYLYGSYARNEQTINSDIDILVITNAKLRIVNRVEDFSIVSATVKELEDILNNNAILVLPIIKEAKTVVNPYLSERYAEYKFTKNNTKSFIGGTARALELNKKGLELNFETGSLVYSLILRIRGLLMIKLMLNNKLYSKSLLFFYLKNYGFSRGEIGELYRIYNNERNNSKVIESERITKKQIGKLLSIAQKLLEEVKNLLK